MEILLLEKLYGVMYKCRLRFRCRNRSKRLRLNRFLHLRYRDGVDRNAQLRSKVEQAEELGRQVSDELPDDDDDDRSSAGSR